MRTGNVAAFEPGEPRYDYGPDHDDCGCVPGDLALIFRVLRDFRETAGYRGDFSLRRMGGRGEQMLVPRNIYDLTVPPRRLPNGVVTYKDIPHYRKLYPITIMVRSEYDPRRYEPLDEVYFLGRGRPGKFDAESRTETCPNPVRFRLGARTVRRLLS